VERSLSTAGHRRRTLEDGFHIVIMIFIRISHIMPIILLKP
jgi:hypothetical protein